MAISPSNFRLPPPPLVLFAFGALAATVTHDFNISWVNPQPSPGTEYGRPVIGINGQWPIPPLYVTKGDNVIINAYNGLGNETTSLHMHGIFMNGTTDMDGAAQVSQCAIPPGNTLTYNFTVNQPGTYWFHSHVRGQYPSGLRAPLIVHDPDSPFQDVYDEEVVLTFSDWYDTIGATLLKSFLSYTNPTGAEPVPDAALMNDTQNLQFAVQPGKTYFFRMVNMAAFAPQYVWFEGHTMRIIEVDGVYTQPVEAEMIYITPAQRYGVLVTMKNDTSANFPIVGCMDTVLFDHIPPSLNPNVTGWLVYNSSNPLPPPTNISEFNPYDDFNLVPYDQEPLMATVDYTATLSFVMGDLGDGVNYALVNNVTYVAPLVPTLYTALTSGTAATSPEIYGSNTNAFVLAKNDVVEIIVNNLDTGKHPFHLHGHNFQAVSRSLAGAGPYNASNASQTDFPQTPVRRDTFLVRPLSNFVIRFRADNPGIWLFHCHIEWHTAAGLIATLIEAPLDLQHSIVPPQNHIQACQAQGIATKGNAAGNTVDLFDLTGENASPPPLPAGFTAKGIVALVFSCLSAFLGLAVISWYGMLPIAGQGANEEKQRGVVEGNAVEGNAVAANAVAANGSTEDVDEVVEQTAAEAKTE